MFFLFLLIIPIVLFSGCATNPYNPVASATNQTFLLNESSLAQIKLGMTQDQVHKIMGNSIVIGYVYQKPLPQDAALPLEHSNYKPLTINNPYKVEDIKMKQAAYTIEYYVSKINQSDGIISDDELTPLVFNQGILVGKGSDYLKTLR